MFLTVWFTFTFTHNGSFIELESVGGNVYLNITIFALIEMCSSMLTGISLRSDKKILKLMIILSFVNASLFLVYFYYPVEQEFEHSFSNLIKFVFPIVAAKTICELSWNLLVLLLPSLFHIEILSKVVSLSILICRIPISVIAYIHYLFALIGIHPFVFYSFLWLLTGFCIKKMHIQENNIKNISKRLRITNGLSSIYGIITPTLEPENSSLTEILLIDDLNPIVSHLDTVNNEDESK